MPKTLHQPAVDIQPRFALLHHAMEAAAGRFDHWDLMLEHSGRLVTLELTRIPTGQGTIQTQRLKDHRLAYLNYEGYISGNRGQVYRLDRGRYHEVLLQEPLPRRRFQVALHGNRLTALIACDQPLFLLPFGLPIELEVLQWELPD